VDGEIVYHLQKALVADRGFKDEMVDDLTCLAFLNEPSGNNFEF
jgi:hypothetical protein